MTNLTEELERWNKLNEEAESDKKYIEEEFNVKKHSLEIAYHEAGHFLFGVLVQKENLGFSKIIEAKIDVTEFKATGNVETKEVNRNTLKEKKEFYDGRNDRVSYRIINLCAGYATYNKFISNNNCEYFIGEFDEVKKVFRRYDLRSAPLYYENFDYRKVKDILRIQHDYTYNDVMEVIIYINNELSKFYSLGGNKCALGFIKNKLYNNNGESLKNNKLKMVIKKVEMHTKKISIKQLVEKVSQRLYTYKNNSL